MGAALYQDALKLVAQLDASGNVTARYVFGSKPNVPDYVTTSAGTFRILSDHLGSPRLVVNSSTGAVAERIDYDEFGNVTQDTQSGFTPFGFAGGLYDKDTGLVRFGARDYDAHVGRWVSKDPIRFDGRSFNLYTYSGSDPIDGSDPNGRLSNICQGNPSCIGIGSAVCYALCGGINFGCLNNCLGAVLPPAPPPPDNSGVFEHCYVIPELEDNFNCYYVCPSSPVVAVPKGQPTDSCDDDHWRPVDPNSCQP